VTRSYQSRLGACRGASRCASLILGISGALWAGAKVFRVGLLMYGKRPSVSEILRALRQA